jgi:hypothetical protein
MNRGLEWLNRIREGKTWLEALNQTAQIALAVVAIFGYFYTVQPIYQKERLAEQVAEYEGIIKTQKPKIAEAEARLAELQKERDAIQQQAKQERDRLTADAEREHKLRTGELAAVERQLAAARDEKAKIERQTQFMTYRYMLPDGTPAVTSEQVRTVQAGNLRSSFVGAFGSCISYSGVGVFQPRGYKQRDAGDKNWPFTADELSAWKEFGADYPRKIVVECIDRLAKKYAHDYPQFASDVEKVQKDALEYATKAAATQWAPPLKPADIPTEASSARAAIDEKKAAELKDVEEKFGQWESILLPDRREIYRANYVIGKQNAETIARSARLSMEFKTVESADSFRKSMRDEAKRLVLPSGDGR